MDAIVKITARSLPHLIKAISSEQKGNENKVDPDIFSFLEDRPEFQKPEII